MIPESAPDTAPIRPEEGFDAETVAGYLREHLADVVGDGPISFDQFPGGKANLTYRAVTPHGELVLRRAPLGPVARGAHDMAREFKVLSRLWRQFPLAPRAFHFCEDPAVMGKPFFVMERRHGYVVRDRWPPEWAPTDHAIRRRAAAALVDALAALHAVDPADVDLADLGRPEGFVARQVDNWSSRWDAAQTREIRALDAAFELLQRHIPAPQPAVVLHNDFKLDNTMVGPDGALVAVFDWDMATLGDPLVDVGTMLAYWVGPDGATYPLLGVDGVTLEPYLSRDEVLERYASATGLDLSAIHFYEGLALCRIAVIIEQIYARYAVGQTTDERFAAFEPLPPIFAAAAVEVLEAG